MKRTRQSWKRFLIGIGVPVLLVSSSVPAAVTEKGKVQQPRNIYELNYSFQFTFQRLLKPEEMKLYETRGPKEIQRINPELYARISADVKRWTDEWIQYTRTTRDPIPEKRLSDGQQLAVKIEEMLARYFQELGWPYRPMQVVFIRPRDFIDEHNRDKTTGGMFIPFYPDAFFATIDWPIPLELVLVHESLHFNAAEGPFGSSLIEGTTDTSARYLARKFELMSPSDLWRAESYPLERKGVETILEKMMERTGRSREQALEVLLETYLTGRQEAMTKIFGERAWNRVLRLSSAQRGAWQTGKIEKALGE